MEVIDVSVRLPSWPFRTAVGFGAICEYDRVLGGDFASVLQSLAGIYGDDRVTFLTVEPRDAYYLEAYASIPAFTGEVAALADGYWDALCHEPRGDPTGAIAYSADVVAIVGASGTWGVWGQRDWELAIVLTPDRTEAWMDADVPFFTDPSEVEALRSPPGWGKPLSRAEITAFLMNMRRRGAGT